jgi:uncharacterized protein YyaL (SSP411 family)
MNRLADAVSPYLRSHADNPVDWFPWGEEAFEEARRRDVPVLVSIGYATCHWCHVMARESFSDPELAASLNERFVAIKVDREEHPDVDATYLAAAGVFTANLGWPLNVFTTPEGRAFFAGTYSPPVAMMGQASFRQVLDAVEDAWSQRRDDVEKSAADLAGLLVTPPSPPPERTDIDFSAVVAELLGHEDRQFGGFGGAPKFPVTPVLLFALRASRAGVLEPPVAEAVDALVRRTLDAMAASGLRDPVEGGFFRYATRRDWTEPHYERMLYDNAQLLRAYAEVGNEEIAAGIVAFLANVLRRASGAFGSAQDSESILDGQRNEGGYYVLDAAERRHQPAPAVDGKVLTGWNGLAIGALARAGALLGRADWVSLAAVAADAVLATRRSDGTLIRAVLDDRPSAAAATLEDYGMLARGLLDLALAGGEVRFAVTGRELLDTLLAEGESSGTVFAVPGGPDATLARRGLALPSDPGEGAYPSGLSQAASAALLLFELTGEERYRRAAADALAPIAALAAQRPISLGGTLEVLAELIGRGRALLVVGAPEAELAQVARSGRLELTAVLSDAQAAAFAEAGFALFEGRASRNGAATAYLCEDFVCRLPVTGAAALAALLAGGD